MREIRPMRKIKRGGLDKVAQPFLILGGDPLYKESNSSELKKVLTNPTKRSILKRIIKLKRKDNKMASQKTDKPEAKAKKTGKMNVVKSIAWLVEAGFRGFVGWVLLSNFDHLVTTIAGVYALGTAAVIVIAHFWRANR